MLTTRTPLVIAAATAIGLAGWMAPQRDDPSGTGQPAPAAEKATQQQYVMLTDGRLVKGVLSEEENMLIVTQPIGAMRYQKKRVEKVFPNLRKVYEYKLEQLPENDLDERMKLSRWCLSQGLIAEAREQLEAILDHNAKHLQAKAMLISLDQSQERQARRQDPEVRQTSGVPDRATQDDRPGSLDAAVISSARRGMGISDMPIVFDLPPAQAVRRTEEFARYVHPVLQNYCARCHNDQYDGNFQLVSFKNKADRTREALKANLDACLKLVDRENPLHSDLLASSLRPHGRGPSKRPIFQGSNDRAYQIMATWVNKLQNPRPAETTRAARTNPGDYPDERFGSAGKRSRSDTENLAADTQAFVTGPVERKVIPPARYEPGKGMVEDTSNDPNEFPLPLPTRDKPRAGAASSAPGAGAVGSRPAPPSSATTTPRKEDTGVKQAAAADDFPPLPDALEAGGAKPASGTAQATPDTETDASAKKPRKPIKLDPKLLQRALQLKNQGR